MDKFLKPELLTPDNYYEAIRPIQNSNCNIDRDIVTFTAFLNWSEKVTHYTRYYTAALKGDLV